MEEAIVEELLRSLWVRRVRGCGVALRLPGKEGSGGIWRDGGRDEYGDGVRYEDAIVDDMAEARTMNRES